MSSPQSFTDFIYEPCETTKQCGAGLVCVEDRCVSGCGKNGTIPCADGCQQGYYLNVNNVYDPSDDRCQTNPINPIYINYSGQFFFNEEPQACEEVMSFEGTFGCEMNQCQPAQKWINASCPKTNELCCAEKVNCVSTNSPNCDTDIDCCTRNDYCDLTIHTCKSRIIVPPDYTHPEKFFCSGKKDEQGNDLLAFKDKNNQSQIVSYCSLKMDEVCRNGECVYLKDAYQKWLDSIPIREDVDVRLIITDQNGMEVIYEEIFEEGTFDAIFSGETLYRTLIEHVSNINPPVLKYCVPANKVAAVIAQEMKLVGNKYCGELKLSAKDLYDGRKMPKDYGDTITLYLKLPFDYVKDYNYNHAVDALQVNPNNYSDFSCYQKGGICSYWGCGRSGAVSLGVCHDSNTFSRQTQCCPQKWESEADYKLFTDPEAEKYAHELEKKYGVTIGNMKDYEWSMEMLNFLDAVLSDLPKFTYINMLYLGGSHKTVGGWAFRDKIGINLQRAKECLDKARASDLLSVEYCKSEIKKTIVHETTHTIDDYLGTAYIGNINIALMEIVERAGWYWDPEFNRYRLFPNSPALFGWSLKEKDGKDFFTLQCDPKTQIKGCNKYWSYQFANPVEMLAVHAEVYFYGSQEFCQRLPDFCAPMRRLFESREYLNGKWINDYNYPYYPSE